MSKTLWLVWVLYMPACAKVNNAMQQFSGVSYETSDQHKGVTKARQLRDVTDTLDLISLLRERHPFVQNNALINITFGLTVESILNVDRAKQIGENILESMVDETVDEFAFRKAHMAVTISSRSKC